MTVIDKMKEGQRLEEIELFSELANAKLESLWMELGLAKRSVRLTDDEATRLLMAAFYTFATQIAVEEGSTREEYLKMMGELFDDALADIVASEEEEDEESGSDKGSTDGGSGPGIVVS